MSMQSDILEIKRCLERAVDETPSHAAALQFFDAKKALDRIAASHEALFKCLEDAVEAFDIECTLSSASHRGIVAALARAREGR